MGGVLEAPRAALRRARQALQGRHGVLRRLAHRPAAQWLPRPQGRAAARHDRALAHRGGRPHLRGGGAAGRAGNRHQSPQGRAPRHRRLRVGRRPRAALSGRAAHAPQQPAHEHRRRAAYGHGRGRRPRQRGRGLVVSVGGRARRGVRRQTLESRGLFDSVAAALHHREPARPAVRERGGELQRPDEAVLQLRAERLRAAEPAGVAHRRPAVPREVHPRDGRAGHADARVHHPGRDARRARY